MKKIIAFILLAALVLGMTPITYLSTVTADDIQFADVTVTPSSFNFPSATVNYTSVTPQTFTVTNSGNQTIYTMNMVLTGTNCNSFQLSEYGISDLQVNASANFTVVPVIGLSAGTYTAAVTIVGAQGIAKNIAISFTVDETPFADVTVTPSSFNFPSATVNYTSVTPQTFTVTNSGNQTINTMNMVLTGTNCNSFQLSEYGISDLQVNASANFTVVPVIGLSAGTYTAAVTIVGAQGIAKNIAISFTVVTSGTAPSITAQPQAQTITAGSTATFSITAAGDPAPTYQWQVCTDGNNWSNVTGGSGGTSASYTTGTATMSMGNRQYRCVATNTSGTATSNAALLTVNNQPSTGTAPSITAQPQAQTITAGSTATFSITAAGDPAPTYQWQVCTDGNNWSDVTDGSGTSASYTTGTVTMSMGNRQYRCVATNISGTATSNAATLTVNLPSTGTAPSITAQPQAQTITAGSTATFSITAAGDPAPTYQWQVCTDGNNWSDVTDGSGTSASYTTGTVTMSMGNRQYRCVATNTSGTATSNAATLTVNAVSGTTYTISVSANGTGNGNVSGGGTYNANTSVTVTATAAAGYHFANWTESGSSVSTDASYNFTATADRTLMAVFEQDTLPATTYTIAVSANNASYGTVSGGGTYQANASVIVTATAGTGYHFVNWTENGGSVSTDVSYTFTATANRTLAAVFEQDTSPATTYTIAVSANNASYGTVSGGGTYQANASVTVTATAGTGYHFVNWTENGGSVSTDVSYTFTATANRTLAAVFEQDTSPATTYTIAVSANNASYGTVSGGGTYQANASVTVTATAGTGYHFVNWTENGGSVSTDVSYTFTATANRMLAAVFEQDTSPATTYTIAVSANNASYGTVSGGGTYQANASVTVTATAGTGYHFVNWKENGNSVSTDASYAFTATANRTLMAVFEQDTSPATTYTIAVSANNASYGTVSGGGTYQANASVTATATAGTGYHFANWTESGSSVSTDVSYTFTATANRTLVAVFEQDASPIPAITIPTSSDKGSVDVSATITGTTAAISVTDSQIEKIVSNQDTTGTVKVDLTSQKTVDTAVIPAKLVDAASSATGSPGLEITMTDGSLTLDKTALSSIGKKDITVRVNTVKPSSLTDTQKTALGDKANDAVIVNVDVLVDAVKTSTFNGGILTISIPYALKADENPDDLTVWYIADDGKVMPMHGKYNAETKSVEFTTTHLSYYAVVNVSVKRLSGDDRYGTMAEIVKQAFPNGCDTAILASGINWPDALAASALAGAKGCPVLLTDSSQLTGETSELLTSLNVKNVIIIGGTAAVSDTVKKAIEAKNIKTERIWGNDRTQTADKIARRVIDESSADTIIICSGQNFPDALSISSYAYAQKMPILLTGSDGKLTTDSLAIADSFSKAIIVGGEDAVSLDVEQQLKTVQPVRYAGKNRHGTSIEIINKLFGGSESILAVATGEDYPDALVGAVLAGKNGGAILLVDGQGTSLTSSQKTIVGNARSVRILGGTAAVSAALETSIDNILK